MVNKESWLIFEGPASICPVSGQVRKASAVHSHYHNLVDKGFIFQHKGPWGKHDAQETNFHQSKEYTCIERRRGKKKKCKGRRLFYLYIWKKPQTCFNNILFFKSPVTSLQQCTYSCQGILYAGRTQVCVDIHTICEAWWNKTCTGMAGRVFFCILHSLYFCC